MRAREASDFKPCKLHSSVFVNPSAPAGI
jgi:hypothetical protein